MIHPQSKRPYLLPATIVAALWSSVCLCAEVPTHDILWYSVGDAEDTLWCGNRVASQGVNGAFRPDGKMQVTMSAIPVVGDFDGNGRDDVLWYAPGSARDSLWLGRPTPSDELNGHFQTGLLVDVPGDFVPLVGDFDANGTDDIFWYGTGLREDMLWRGSTTDRGGANGWFATSGEMVNADGEYEPIAADFNGDGACDILWYGRGPKRDTLWFGRRTRSALRNESFQIGKVIDVPFDATPVAGDFNGDGPADVLWVDQASGTSHLWLGGTENDAAGNGWFDTSRTIAIGRLGSPHVGDFDGDSCDDILWVDTAISETGWVWRGYQAAAPREGQLFRQRLEIRAPRSAKPVIGVFEESTTSASRAAQIARVEWRRFQDDELATAKRQGKPVLVYFRIPEASPCRDFEQKLLVSNDFIRHASQFACLFADVGPDSPLATRYQVRVVPHVLLLSADGEVAAQVKRPPSPDVLLDDMKRLIK